MRSRVAAAVAVLVATVLLTGCGAFSDAFDVVQDKYERAASQDDGTAKAFRADDPVSQVADDIAGEKQPLDRLTAGDREYLQYDEHIVRVEPASGGSTVLVDDYSSGYQRWSEDVGSEWGAQEGEDGGSDEGK